MDRLKPRLATAWLGGCSGCHMSFLDLDERLIDLAGLVDLCYSPIADIKEFPEEVDIALVEGAVANQDHLREIRLIRERSKILIAFGDCAVTGNVRTQESVFAGECSEPGLPGEFDRDSRRAHRQWNRAPAAPSGAAYPGRRARRSFPARLPARSGCDLRILKRPAGGPRSGCQ